MTAAVDRALKALDQVSADLAGEYTRRVHQPRLDQITAHLTGLRSLIAQLPDEEEREADYHARLLAAHDSGMLQRDDHGQVIGWNHDARQRLADALAGREEAAP